MSWLKSLETGQQPLEANQLQAYALLRKEMHLGNTELGTFCTARLLADVHCASPRRAHKPLNAQSRESKREQGEGRREKKGRRVRGMAWEWWGAPWE